LVYISYNTPILAETENIYYLFSQTCSLKYNISQIRKAKRVRSALKEF